MNLFRFLIYISLFLLSIQFIDGMWLNLFVQFSPFTGMMNFMFNYGPIFMFHVFIGFILFILSLIGFVAFTRNQPIGVFLPLLNLLSIIMAGISGMLFMMTGFSNNYYSFIMAIGFIISIMSNSLMQLTPPRPGRSRVPFSSFPPSIRQSG